MKLQHESNFTYELQKRSEGKKKACVHVCVYCVLPRPSFVLRQDVAPPFENGVPRERKKPLAKSSRSTWKLRVTTVGVVKFVLFTI